MNEEIPIPIIHSNGTSREELLRQLLDAMDALDAADRALAHATPHGRDYYPQGDTVINEATRLHRARREAVMKVYLELRELAEALR